MKLIVCLFSVVALTSCVVTTPAVITPVSTPSARPIAAGVEARPIQFRRIVIDVERGKHIGQVQGGWLCVPQGDLTWRTGRTIVNDEDLIKTFREELTKANYPVAGDPNSLFDDPSEARAEILVAGRVIALQANLCYSPSRVGDAKGEAAMTVEWQIFSRTERRVVHKTTTRGAGRLNEFTGSGVEVVFQNAFAQATRGLLGDANFHALVSGTGIAAPPPPSAIPAAFQLQPRTIFTGPITQRMTEVQGAVVTVIFPGGHGSGFFISSDGYALTNSHVVGNAKTVKLRLSTGREISAEVIASNRTRDVALLKAADSGISALPIATSELPVGSDVYAHGSPLSASLASTVTRGIIGAYRADDSLRLIQSDVTIQRGNSGGPLTDASGNVVAVAVAGLAPRGVTMGLNFFIPIDDALKGVAIARGEARAAARMARLDQNLPEGLQPGPAASPVQVAAVSPTPPEPVKLDGEYKSLFIATTLQGRLTFELYLTLVGNTVKGSGTLPASRFGAVCRANGTVSGTGDALIDVDCSSSAFTQSLKLKGRFAPDEGDGVVIGRLVYSSNGGTGDAIFRP